jgi:pimeloyl-ACP methyl ester carboxylesterase
LIVWGDQDPIIPVSHAYDTHDAIPGSRLEIFKGSGHFPQDEDPTHFAEVLLDFIATTVPATVTDEEWAAQLGSRTPAS